MAVPHPAPPVRPAPEDPDKEPTRIRAMFDAVAPRYDLLNRLLSAGIDIRWRRRAIDALALSPGDRLLDLCAGTGDLGYEALRRVPGVQVVGVDLSRNMLHRGREKGRGDRGAPGFVQGDVLALPLADASVDAVSVGFGIRNVASLEDAFRETARVLRPGGRFAVLEFTLPPHPLVRGLYRGYFHHVLPRVGGWISGRPDPTRTFPIRWNASPARRPWPRAWRRRGSTP